MSKSDRHWFDERRRTNLERRSDVLKAVRAFFDARGFVEVETPTMVPSPGLDFHIDAFGVVGAQEARWLCTSPEYQMKRLLSAGFEQIYQLGRCFRRHELGHLHEPEFTLLEWYRTKITSNDTMEDTEQLVAHVARSLTGATALCALGIDVDVEPPWKRQTVQEAFSQLAGVDASSLDEDRFFEALVTDVQPKLGAGKPVWLTHWPAGMASLAQLHADDPTTSDRFEAYVGGIEICNGFGELTDAQEQRARFVRDRHRREAAGRPVYPIDERLIEAMEVGLPTCSGNALGVDRLVMLVLGATHIEDVVAIPASRL